MQKAQLIRRLMLNHKELSLCSWTFQLFTLVSVREFKTQVALNPIMNCGLLMMEDMELTISVSWVIRSLTSAASKTPNALTEKIWRELSTVSHVLVLMLILSAISATLGLKGQLAPALWTLTRVLGRLNLNNAGKSSARTMVTMKSLKVTAKFQATFVMEV